MLKLILVLGIEFAKHEIIKAIVREFIVRGLDKTYEKEIEEWMKYIREKEFDIKLDEQMREEIRRFRKTIKGWTPKELEEFVIEGLLLEND